MYSNILYSTHMITAVFDQKKSDQRISEIKLSVVGIRGEIGRFWHNRSRKIAKFGSHSCETFKQDLTFSFLQTNGAKDVFN